MDNITVGSGVPLTIPIRAINRSEAVWGPDAKKFEPERWLDNRRTPDAQDAVHKIPVSSENLSI